MAVKRHSISYKGWVKGDAPDSNRGFNLSVKIFISINSENLNQSSDKIDSF